MNYCRAQICVALGEICALCQRLAAVRVSTMLVGFIMRIVNTARN